MNALNTMFAMTTRGLAMLKLVLKIARLANQRITSPVRASQRRGGLARVSASASAFASVSALASAFAFALALGLGVGAPSPAAAQTPPTATLTGPSSVQNGTEATYTVTFSSPITAASDQNLAISITTGRDLIGNHTRDRTAALLNSTTIYVAGGGASSSSLLTSQSLYLMQGATSFVFSIGIPSNATTDGDNITINLLTAINNAYTIATQQQIVVDIVAGAVLTLRPATLSIAEGDSANLTVDFGLAATSDTVVNLTTSDGTATSGTDYTALPASVTVTSGNSNATVSIATIDNDLSDGNRTFNITASSGTMNATTQVTITNDDVGVGARPVQGKQIISGIMPPPRTPGVVYEEIDDNFTVEFYRGSSGTDAIEVGYEVTANSGDYLADSVTTGTMQTVMIAENENTTRVTFAVDNDTVAEDRGQVTVAVVKHGSVSPLAGAAGSAVFTMVDDERPEVSVTQNPQLTTLDPGMAPVLPDGTRNLTALRETEGQGVRSPNESEGEHQFGLVVRPVGAAVNVTVRITREGSVFAGLSESERVTTHTIELNGTDTTGNVLGAGYYADGYGPGNANGSVPAGRLAALNVTWNTSDTSYSGEGSRITVEVVDDNDPAYNAWDWSGELATVYGPASGPQRVAVIQEDDDPPALVLGDVPGSWYIGETAFSSFARANPTDMARNATLHFTLDGSNSTVATSFRLALVTPPRVTIPTAVGGASCTEGVDYIAHNQTYTLTAGVRSRDIDLQEFICADGVVDNGTREEFEVQISEVMGATVHSSLQEVNPQTGNTEAGTGIYWINGKQPYILDLDPQFSITASPNPVVEGENITFTVATQPGVPVQNGDVTVPFNIDMGMADLNATAAGGTLPDTVVIMNGTESANFTLTTNLVDGVNQAGPIAVSLTYPEVADFAASSSGSTRYWVNATAGAVGVQIQDSELALNVVVVGSDPATPLAGTVTEGQSVTLNLSITSVDPQNVTLNYTTVDDTAIAGDDYTLASRDGDAFMVMGQVNRTVTVATSDNVVNEGSRSFNVTFNLTSESGAFVEATAVITIEDDDAMPMLTLEGPSEVAPGENVTYVIGSGDTRPGEDLQVMVEVNGSVAAIYNGTDEIVPVEVMSPVRLAQNTSTPVAVTIGAGQASTSLVVTASNQPNAMISVRLLPPVGTGASYNVSAAAAQGMQTQIIARGFDTQQLNRVLLPHVAITLLDEAGSAIAGRTQDSFGDASRGNRRGFRINGEAVDDFAVNTLLGFAAAEAERDAAENPWDVRASDDVSADSLAVRLQEYLPDQHELSFTLGLNPGEGRGVAVWGQGFQRNLSGDQDGVDFDGSVPGSVVGVDARVSENLLAGVGFSTVAAEFDYATGAGMTRETGEHATDLTAIHPYVGYRTEGGGNVWATLGIGEGEVTISQDGEAAEYVGEVQLDSFGLGFTTLRETGRNAGGRDITLNYYGDVLVGHIEETPTARTRGQAAFADAEGVELDIGRVRLGATLSQARGLAGGGVFTQSLDLALRHDSGDLAEGGAIEVGGAIGLDTRGGLRLDLSARTLLSHEEAIDDWGVRGGLAWVSQPGAGGRGLAVSVSPEWGNTASRAGEIWGAGLGGVEETLGRSVDDADGDAASYAFDVKYGIPVLGEGLLVPFVTGDAGDIEASARYGSEFSLGRFAAGVASEGSADDDAATAFIRYSRDF